VRAFYGYPYGPTKEFFAQQHCRGCMVWKAGKTPKFVTKAQKTARCNAVVMIKITRFFIGLAEYLQNYLKETLDIVSLPPSSAKCGDLDS